MRKYFDILFNRRCFYLAEFNKLEHNVSWDTEHHKPFQKPFEEKTWSRQLAHLYTYKQVKQIFDTLPYEDYKIIAVVHKNEYIENVFKSEM